MRRWIAVAALVAVFAIVVSGLLLQRTADAGGGGCHNPVTDAAGDRVVLQQNCMMPTILRTEPGATITFTNHDEALHSVTGASTSWGDFDTMGQMQTVTQTFENDGIYPYFCVLHPGMIGAIVVGDASGTAAVDLNGDSKLGVDSPSELVSAAPNAAADVDVEASGGGRVVAASVLSGAIALLVGVAATALVLRNKQRV